MTGTDPSNTPAVARSWRTMSVLWIALSLYWAICTDHEAAAFGSLILSVMAVAVSQILERLERNRREIEKVFVNLRHYGEKIP